ncbi:MAG TPA: cytochrome c, partial [Chitinophagaceae bacterium]|nr:cytochrome c [Chitinophagaceae bacterium]
MKRFPRLAASILLAGVLLASCGGGEAKPAEEQPVDVTTLAQGEEVHGDLIKASDVQLTTPLNAEWVTAGKGIYEMKCQSCHKLTEEKLVGPGWKGVTQKREPHWIMNMITNVDIMLEKDAEAQKLLEQCLVRMPNQNVSKEDARK